MSLSVPDTGGRYYVFGLFDMWSNVFASIGKRTTGTAAARFLIAGPGWKGTPPDDVTETYRSPTRFVWVNGQMQADGPQECAGVTALQKQYRLTPLSAWGSDWSPPAEVPVPSGLDTTPPLERVQKLDAGTFFGRVARLMKDNPPAPADAKIVNTLKKVGIEPGKDFDIAAVDKHTAKGLQRAMGTFGLLQKALTKLKTANGWIVIPDNFADYGTDYKTRAGIALIGLRRDLAAGRRVSHCVQGRRRQAARRREPLRPPLRRGPDATRESDLVRVDVRPAGLLRPERHRPLQRSPVDAARVQRGRLARHLHPGRVARRGEGVELAPRTRERAVQPSGCLYWPTDAVLDGTYKLPPVKRLPPTGG